MDGRASRAGLAPSYKYDAVSLAQAIESDKAKMLGHENAPCVLVVRSADYSGRHRPSAA